MHLQRILVIENNTLIGAIIECVLAREKNMAVTGITPQNEIELLQEVWSLQPHVILIDQDSRLTTPTRLLSRFHNMPELKIITISLHENSFMVYSKKKHSAAYLTDLATAVQDNSLQEFTFRRQPAPLRWDFLPLGAEPVDLS